MTSPANGPGGFADRQSASGRRDAAGRPRRRAAQPTSIARERYRDCALIALAWISVAAILRPFQDTPFIDDWVYAWPVEQLLLGRPLKVIDYSSSLNVVQAWWGALFCLPAGFSFVALRISTWVAALACLWILYLLLRELDVGRKGALLGVATLGSNPIFFVLSISFMTDIPFLAAMLATVLAFHRAVMRRQERWLWAATVLAALAMGIRLNGTALPVAMTVALVAHMPAWGRQRLRFLVPLTALIAVAGMTVWRAGHTEHVADLSLIPNAPGTRLTYARLHALELLPQMLAGDATFVASALGLAMLPLAIACARRAHMIAAVAVFVALWSVVAVTALMGWPQYPPLASGATWALEELGATEPLIPGYTRPGRPSWLVWSIAAIAFASSAVVVSVFLHRPRTVGLALVRWIAAITFVLLAVLWLLYDRYALTLFPLAILYLLAHESLRRPHWAIAVLALCGLYSVLGVRDHLHYNAAVWHAVDELRRRGVPAAQIDGGYVVNGWLQYAHAEHAARDATGAVAVPGVTVDATLRYQVSNAALPGASVIATVPYVRWLGRSGTIYVVDRERGEPRSFKSPPSPRPPSRAAAGRPRSPSWSEGRRSASPPRGRRHRPPWPPRAGPCVPARAQGRDGRPSNRA